MTAEIYDRTPDRIILESYLAPRDDDHQIIPLWRRLIERLSGETTVAAKFPSVEELQVPQEAFGIKAGMPMSFILMFFAVGRRREWSTEKIMEALRKA